MARLFCGRHFTAMGWRPDRDPGDRVPGPGRPLGSIERSYPAQHPSEVFPGAGRARGRSTRGAFRACYGRKATQDCRKRKVVLWKRR